MKLLQVLLFWISGTVSVFAASNCADDVHGQCKGWSLDKSGVCLRITESKKNYNKAQADCKKLGGDLVNKADVTGDFLKCLADIHPHQKRKMVFLIGRKDCTVYDLKGKGIRYPGCHKKRYYACQKPALPVPTTKRPSTQPPTTTVPTTKLPSTQPPTTTEPSTTPEPTSTPTPPISSELPSTSEELTSDEIDFDDITDHFHNCTGPTGQPTLDWTWPPNTDVMGSVEISGKSSDDSSSSSSSSSSSGSSSGSSSSSDSSSGKSSSNEYTSVSTYILTLNEDSSTSEPDLSTESRTMESSSHVTDSPGSETTSGMESSPTGRGSFPSETFSGVKDMTQRPAQSEALQCPEGFFVASDTLCVAVERDLKTHSEASQACVDKGAQLMRYDQMNDYIKNHLKETEYWTGGHPILKLDQNVCLFFNNGGIERSTCQANTPSRFLCAIDHGRAGGSTMGTAAPVAGATIAVTSIAILVSVLVP